MHNIRMKLILPFIIGTILLTVFLSLYTYTSARKAVENAVLLISEATTMKVGNSMDLLFASMTTSVTRMVADPNITTIFSSYHKQDETVSRAIDWLTMMVKANELYRDIIIVDKDGVCIASSNPSHIGNSYNHYKYVQQALGGMFTFGDLSVGKVTKKLSVTAVAPIAPSTGIKGALLLINDLPKIVDYNVVSTLGSQTLYTSLLTSEGVFVAHPNNGIMGKQSEEHLSLYRELLTVGEKGGPVSYTLNGIEYIGFAKIEANSKWLVITSGPVKEVFASAYHMGMVVFIISLIFLAIISVVVTSFANGILESLLSLIQYAKRVSEGELDQKLEKTSRTDELGTLHTALQNLVSSLQSMIEKTQEASKMKSAFLANMSHEIRTPLNAILGMAHLALRNNKLPEKELDYLNKIEVAAKSLLQLINDILDLSKVEADMLTIEEVSFNLDDTINNILSIHQESAKAKGLSLLADYQVDTPKLFMGDPLRIGQVLNNLLGNAIKFTQEGKVSIHCWLENKQEVQNGSQNAVVYISVKDSGIGMSEKVIASLFQPFMQADASITRQFGGTGLGLAISQRLVRIMGGEIEVSSIIGQGSTFTFSLNLLINQAPESTAQLTETCDFADIHIEGKRILVAEDNAINQFIVEELLAPSKATVVLADNGQLAVEAVSKEHFDLVLMDMQMPVMDGLKATMHIREFNKTIPIIAVTANAMDEDRQNGFAAGMNDYLTKPIEPEALRKTLIKWLKTDCPPPLE
ncbi:hybrid sensor histidine kinase/response regulator [Desulfovibrio litoralis]|uniref:histidine kinase n=1 Tax=Desulfovibrio litoralis DSM 11393 TaxID=1121455 RepID=A0A1M7TJH4_9BACT|nr:response regulator [Desulfovibrio litoralis]SHN70768.1 Signal transduction histidine kinase [Desulfovibrio litoralis DSM 11393]